MDNYIVSARKYRPSTFKSVVGQKALTQTLKNAIDSHKLAHAYLFCGPRGVGKTSCARIFAKTINCLHPTETGEACNECESCKAFNEQRSYNIMELDAASNNSVEDIRTLIDQVRIPPQIGKYKVFIIDEVHMLSAAAFNAFLKTLEEPPHHAIFVLATTEKHKLLPTILSRCQIYDFQRITTADITEHLQYVASQEGLSTETEALNIIANKADGGMRDALSIFDQVVSFTGGNITYKAVIENLNVLDYEYYFKLVDSFLNNDVSQALMVFKKIRDNGLEAQYFVSGLSNHFRDLLVSKDPVTLPLLEVGPSVAQRYGEQAARCSQQFLYKAMELSNRCDLDYRISSNKQFLVELMLIQICQITITATEESPSPKNPPLQKLNPVTTIQPAVTPPQTTIAQAKPVSPEPNAVLSGITSPSPSKESPHAPNLQINQKIENPVHKAPTPPRISIKLGGQAQEEEQQAQAPQVILNTPFTQEQLQTSWLHFTETISTEVALVNTMRSSLPYMLDQTRFEVAVENKMQVELLNNRGTELMEFLKQELRNNQITMQTKINEKGESQKIFGPKELFQHMAEKNSSLKDLADTFGLEMA